MAGVAVHPPTSNSTTANGDASLAEELNCFFYRFEVKPEDLFTILSPALNNNKDWPD
jgi:hypothetical protein